MSLDVDISSAIQAIKTDIKSIFPVIERYSEIIEQGKTHLELKNKRIDFATIEQSSWLNYYDERRIELKKVLELVQILVDKKYGALWKHYTENVSLDMSPKDKDHYIKTDERYLIMKEVLLEVRELYEKAEALVEAFKARGYSINNLTRLYTNNVNEIML